METRNGIPVISAKNPAAWRAWLEKHCETEKSVWLIVYHAKSKTSSVHFQEAIEQAVCFGWVDSVANKRDAESFYLCFNRRNPKSTWGRISRARAEKMLQQGLMTPHGQAAIDLAKQTGTWDALADAQNLTIPDDLQKRLDQNKVALKNFSAFPPSSQRLILEWIAKAKKTETRQARVAQTVELAAKNQKANHPRP